MRTTFRSLFIPQFVASAAQRIYYWMANSSTGTASALLAAVGSAAVDDDWSHAISDVSAASLLVGAVGHLDASGNCHIVFRSCARIP